MIISSSKKFIFYHTPKTGGESIHYSLLKYQDTLYRLQYRRIAKEKLSYLYPPTSRDLGLIGTIPGQFIESKEDSLIKGYFLFCFIRNPWDRLVSFYRYLLMKYNDPGSSSVLGFTTFVKLLMRGSPMFEDLRELAKIAWYTQMLWINDIHRRPIMDFVGRFERLPKDFSKVCKLIGLPKHRLPHRNKTNHLNLHYSRYYNDFTKQAVAEHFREDIEYGGYKFETE